MTPDPKDTDPDDASREGTGRDIPLPDARPPRAFFGRRKGHPLRRHHGDLVATLLPRLALDLAAPPPVPLAALFATPVARVRMEIGFGGGEHLVAQAAAEPDAGFIGCEPFVNGMAQALALIETTALGNIRLHHGDATEVLAWLPDAALTRLDLLYPDPWPKRRHWKRRFVQDDSVAALARVLADGGEFRFATDWSDYASWTLERLLRSPDFAWTAERADDWRQPWAGWTRTRYEAKAVREGRTPCYLVFRRVARG
ncbi:tRNA (guanosine(46)-N7)-methyltransferase TrmB [Rhodoplanes serenus]|uniref:tRNA (guanosine(46)-N7)-methyltransferase TrmB n=1 Tax=Rhodoplanes serenus TaxID=200615 RepID=UPI000DAC982C|nr:tRNA (guanosine(46)-N7)-methyltransferase TrmB [Rhodoplanes serenus]RAI31139.1 tRNA (guanosine(46)-N7)-methyltransferase TrmB [Rhodoplanes serenus]